MLIRRVILNSVMIYCIKFWVVLGLVHSYLSSAYVSMNHSHHFVIYSLSVLKYIPSIQQLHSVTVKAINIV